MTVSSGHAANKVCQTTISIKPHRHRNAISERNAIVRLDQASSRRVKLSVCVCVCCSLSVVGDMCGNRQTDSGHDGSDFLLNVLVDVRTLMHAENFTLMRGHVYSRPTTTKWVRLRNRNRTHPSITRHVCVRVCV